MPPGCRSTATSRSLHLGDGVSTPTTGFGVLGDHLAARAAMSFADYVRDGRVQPLGLELDPTGHPGAGMRAHLDDMLAFCRELLAADVRRGRDPWPR